MAVCLLFEMMEPMRGKIQSSKVCKKDLYKNLFELSQVTTNPSSSLIFISNEQVWDKPWFEWRLKPTACNLIQFKTEKSQIEFSHHTDISMEKDIPHSNVCMYTTCNICVLWHKHTGGNYPIFVKTGKFIPTVVMNLYTTFILGIISSKSFILILLKSWQKLKEKTVRPHNIQDIWGINYFKKHSQYRQSKQKLVNVLQKHWGSE